MAFIKEYILKKALVLGLLTGLCVFPLSAANVSVLVMETGQIGHNPNSHYSVLWEDGLLEVFFESGHIVSNFPILRLTEKPEDDFPYEAEHDFNNAKAGGMEYFIITIVDYTQAGVSLRLFSTNSREMIWEYNYTIKTFRNTKEEYENIKTAISTLIAHLK